MAEGAAGPADPAAAEARIRRWLAGAVVGLKLCPFARPLLDAANLRIAICSASRPQHLRRTFLQELDLLQRSSEAQIATTLIAFTDSLQSFSEYLEFLDEAQQLLEEAGLEGVVQLASFHPHYQFAGEPEDAASHFSNRSPLPLLHLLREEMLTRVLAEDGDPEGIPQRNIATLEAIGVQELERRWRDFD